MKKEKVIFERIFFNNRWKQKKYSRKCDWVIIGISENWFGPTSFCYKISFLGFDLNIWFKRELID